MILAFFNNVSRRGTLGIDEKTRPILMNALKPIKVGFDDFYNQVNKTKNSTLIQETAIIRMLLTGLMNDLLLKRIMNYNDLTMKMENGDMSVIKTSERISNYLRAA